MSDCKGQTQQERGACQGKGILGVYIGSLREEKISATVGMRCKPIASSNGRLNLALAVMEKGLEFQYRAKVESGLVCLSFHITL